MTIREINLLHRDLFIKYGNQEIDLITTHASWVLLTPEYAYKIKKPVKFSFLDYSTLEKRKAACQKELHLNRRFTKGMYLDVVRIHQQNDRYFLESETGELLDYALKMTKMDPARQMDHLLIDDQVSFQDMNAIARQLVHFHKTTERKYNIVDIDMLKEQFNDLLVIKPLLEKYFDQEAVEILETSIRLSNQFLEDHIHRLLERQQKGYVLDGHGDLHSRNIFLMDEPVIFDCIEFNEDFRLMDILNEIAFFCMDLDFFKKHQLAAHFLQEYLKHYPCIENIEDWNIFHYFKLYRANVRLKVNGLNALQAEEAEELKPLLAATTDYLHLYKYYLKALG
jgi:aminoglycoside phosphotransferase family enzyme